MNHKTLRIVIASILVLTGHVSGAVEIQRDWLMSIGAPCEGIGVHGAMRGHIEIRGRNTTDGFEIQSITAWITTGAALAGKLRISGYAAIVEDDAENQKTLLGRPTRTTIESAPAPNESSKIYMANGTKMLAPPGGLLRVSLGASVELSGGACALGSSSEDIRLPKKTGGVQP